MSEVDLTKTLYWKVVDAPGKPLYRPKLMTIMTKGGVEDGTTVDPVTDAIEPFENGLLIIDPGHVHAKARIAAITKVQASEPELWVGPFNDVDEAQVESAKKAPKEPAVEVGALKSELEKREAAIAELATSNADKDAEIEALKKQLEDKAASGKKQDGKGGK